MAAQKIPDPEAYFRNCYCDIHKALWPSLGVTLREYVDKEKTSSARAAHSGPGAEKIHVSYLMHAISDPPLYDFHPGDLFHVRNEQASIQVIYIFNNSIEVHWINGQELRKAYWTDERTLAKWVMEGIAPPDTARIIPEQTKSPVLRNHIEHPAKASCIIDADPRYRIVFMETRPYVVGEVTIAEPDYKEEAIHFPRHMIEWLTEPDLLSEGVKETIPIAAILEVIDLETGESFSPAQVWPIPSANPSTPMNSNAADALDEDGLLDATLALLYLSWKLRGHPRQRERKRILDFIHAYGENSNFLTDNNVQALRYGSEADYLRHLANIPSSQMPKVAAAARQIARGSGRRKLPVQVINMIERDFSAPTQTR